MPNELVGLEAAKRLAALQSRGKAGLFYDAPKNGPAPQPPTAAPGMSMTDLVSKYMRPGQDSVPHTTGLNKAEGAELAPAVDMKGLKYPYTAAVAMKDPKVVKMVSELYQRLQMARTPEEAAQIQQQIETLLGQR